MTGKPRVPIEAGLLTPDLGPAADIRLAGSRCRNCGEVFLGPRNVCENCSASSMEQIAFSKKGSLWSYTIIRHEPPPGYKVPGPFEPYGLGLVELPEGIRILSPIDCDLDQLEIGMRVVLVVEPLYENEQGEEVMAFKFEREAEA